MITDVGLPIRSAISSRDEVLIVYFDGFIKNTSEGMIRTMLRDEDDWIEKYPKLKEFREMSQDDIYDNTILLLPAHLLWYLSDGNITEKDIEDDLDTICSDIILENSKITTFEYCLHTILEEKNIKKCYIFKDTAFYGNEVRYIKKQFDTLMSKIEFVSGGFLTLFESINPTTIFLTDTNLVLDFIVPSYPESKIKGMMFIVLNTMKNIVYNEKDDTFIHEENLLLRMDKENEKSIIGITTMFNFALTNNDQDDILNEDEEDDNQEEIFQEYESKNKIDSSLFESED